MKITIKDMVKKNAENYYNVNCNGIELKIKRNIKADEMQYFVNKVVDSAFSSGSFSPFLRDITKSLMIARVFVCQNDTEGIEIPDNADDSLILYNWMKDVGFEDAIKNDDKIRSTLLEIESAIDEQVEFEKKKICSVLSQDTETVEAIKNFNNLIDRCSFVVDTIEKVIDKNASKISKYLTPKKIDAFLNNFQEKAINYIKQEHNKNSEK